MDKKKKILIAIGIVEAAFLIFALVLSIIVWSTIPSGEFPTTADYEKACMEQNEFIGFFQVNNIAFFCIICIPVFVIIAIDFIYFAMVASKRETNLSDKQMAAIKKRAEEEVRAELMKEMEAELQEEQPKNEQ